MIDIIEQKIEKTWTQPVPSWDMIEGYGLAISSMICTRLGHWNVRNVSILPPARWRDEDE